jgi:peroxiredoxin Q/BCP
MPKTLPLTADFPQVGESAPKFKLPGYPQQEISLNQLLAQGSVLLYFYPKDLTSGCTKQAEAFAEHYKKFKKLGVEIVGISPDSVQSHEKFTAKIGIPFPLGSDPDHVVAQKYGVWVEKSMYGRKYWGIQRASFLISPKGKIQAAWNKVKVAGHWEEVLQTIREHQ